MYLFLGLFARRNKKYTDVILYTKGYWILDIYDV